MLNLEFHEQLILRSQMCFPKNSSPQMKSFEKKKGYILTFPPKEFDEKGLTPSELPVALSCQ